jgi:regulator of sigma E protease
VAQIWSTIQTPLAFLFVLGVLVFIHEAGHFLMARWHGVRVITFSLGFGPKLLKWKPGATEYCVSLIPLGGYVKLAGETVEEERTGAPDEFMSQSKWVRFQVYVMGPVMNIGLAFLLTTVVLYRGADVPLDESAPPVIGKIAPGSAAEKAGLQVGDRILTIAGKPVPTWTDVSMSVVTKANREVSITVRRGNEDVMMLIKPDSETKYEIGDLGVLPVMRPQVLDLSSLDGPAAVAGLRKGDVFIEVDGNRGFTREQIIEHMQKRPGQPIVFLIERDGAQQRITVTPRNNNGIGQIHAFISPYETKRVDPTLLQAFQMSAKETWSQSLLIGKTLGGLFTRETPVKQLMGPIAIAELSGSAARISWLSLIAFMSMISLNLGVLNLMPIPVLDGGHIAILALEGLVRRDFSVKVKERILFAGFAMIMLLMVTVIYNDVARLFR